MSSWYDGQRPITVAILAMGGEGGGVLSDWIVDLAESNGYVAQSTSVAGVAQRTGATVYYVEMLPEPPEGRNPVLSVFPAPGEVDVVIASELMEAGRSIQRGFCTPDRTTLIASTSRVFSMSERTASGDGRVDDDELLRAAHAGSARFIGGDFMSMATQAGSVISASLFGALAQSEALPFKRKQFEKAIKKSGKGVEKSLAAFERGVEAAGQPAPQPAPAVDDLVAAESGGAETVAVSIGRKPESAKAANQKARAKQALADPASLVGPALRSQAERVGSEFPAAARSMLLHGCERTAVYQDLDYTDRYLDRVARLAAVDPARDGDAALTAAAARHVALWMCYQDTVQVAQQKIRKARIDGVREEAKAGKKQLMQVREYLHPQVEEITATLPTGIGRRLAKSKLFAKVVGKATKKGWVINTTSNTGYTMLWITARLRSTRPKSFRFGREQAAIDAWLDTAIDIAATDAAFATEIIECEGVIKGYGETHRHGSESFARLMAAVDELRGHPAAASTLAGLRAAAVADEDGAALTAALAAMPQTLLATA